MKVSRFHQSIHAAREGIHTNPFGEQYEVTHEAGRTYCLPVEVSEKVKWEPESGRGQSSTETRLLTNTLLSSSVRQQTADQNYAPRRPTGELSQETKQALEDYYGQLPMPDIEGPDYADYE